MARYNESDPAEEAWDLMTEWERQEVLAADPAFDAWVAAMERDVRALEEAASAVDVDVHLLIDNAVAAGWAA